MVETLICPGCSHRVKTDKTASMPNDKRATCPKCKKSFTLGEARVTTEESSRSRKVITAPKPQTPPIIAARVVQETDENSLPSPLAAPDSSEMTRFAAQGQNPAMIEKLLNRIREICTSQEEPLYMAVQQRPVANLSPDAVVLTNRRLIIFRQKMLGRMEFEDCMWKNVHDVHMKENLIGATLTVTATNGAIKVVEYVPKAQARQIYRIAQEMEENMVEFRRNRSMEEARNAAGHVVVQNAVTPSAAPAVEADPVAKLAQLKKMLEADLISEEEYSAKKSEIMSRM